MKSALLSCADVTGVKAMTWILKHWSVWTRHEIVLILAALMLAGAVTYLAIKLVRPQPQDTVMGDRWQCSKTALIITTCTKRPT
jgi:hypothetical protein